MIPAKDRQVGRVMLDNLNPTAPRDVALRIRGNQGIRGSGLLVAHGYSTVQNGRGILFGGAENPQRQPPTPTPQFRPPPSHSHLRVRPIQTIPLIPTNAPHPTSAGPGNPTLVRPRSTPRATAVAYGDMEAVLCQSGKA